MGNALDKYIAVVLTHRWLVLLVSVAVAIGVGAGARYLTTTNDIRFLFSDDNPRYQALVAMEERFTSTSTALVAFAPKKKEETVFTRETLTAIEDFTRQAWEVPYTRKVSSLTNHIHSEASEDELSVRELVEDSASLSDADIQRIEEITKTTIDLPGFLVSGDGKVSGLAITFVLPEDPLKSDAAIIEIVDYIEDLVEKAEKRYPDIRYYLTGDVVISRVYAKITDENLQELIPIMIPIILIVTMILLRSVLGCISVFATAFLVVNITMGFAGWTGVVLSPASVLTPIIVSTIVVAHTVHVASAVSLNMAGGVEQKIAIAEALRTNAWPLFLSSLTTIIGFLSLNASEVQPFRDIGNLTAFGIVVTFLFSVSFMPAMLAVLRLRKRTLKKDRLGMLERLAEFVISNNRLLLVGVGAVAIVMSLGVLRIEFNDNATRYMDERYQFRHDTDFVIDNLTSVEPIEYTLEVGVEGAITDPKYIQAVDAFAEWYRQQPEVGHVQSFSDTMKRLNRIMNGDDPAFYRVPDNTALAGQYLLLYELSLPAGSDLNDRIDVAKSATRMTVQVRGHPSAAEQRGLVERADAWLRANHPNLTAEPTGYSVASAYLSLDNATSMLHSTGIAMFLISLIFLILLRSARLGIISLLPNFVPLIVTFGIWGFFVSELNLAGAMVSIMAFGIIVDDTIHFLSKYQSARKEGKNAADAVRYTFRTVGHALLTTTMALCAGFLVLTLSGFKPIWTTGSMVSVAILVALLADFLLLPALLVVVYGRKAGQKA